MFSSPRRRVPHRVLPLLLVSVGLASAGQGSGSRADADRFEAKVAAIERFGERPTKAGQRTPVTEAELNAYFANQGRQDIPAGVVEPQVWMLGGGQLSGRAVVDLDAVRAQHQSTGWFDPMSYLSGRLPVTATGTLRTREGQAWLDLETIRISGLPIPKRLLQELVSYYSRTPEMPEGLNLDDPFPLPARIREIDVQRPHEAVIVQ
jgi:hypothetical protein